MKHALLVLSCVLIFLPVAHGDPLDDKIALLDRSGVETDTAGMIAYLELLQPDAKRQEEIDTLIAGLSSADWNVRESASRRLVRIGEPARAKLDRALKSPDPEVRWRANRILEDSDFSSESHTRRTLTLAALDVLKSRGDAQAVKVLLATLPVLTDELLRSAASEALWACVDASHLKMLSESINSKNVPQRAAVVVALEIAAANAGPDRAGATVEKIRPLLGEGVPLVRLSAARALIDREPEAAVKTLIELAGQKELDVAWQADAMLRLKTGVKVEPADQQTLGEAWWQWAEEHLAGKDLSQRLGDDRLDLEAGRAWLVEFFDTSKDSVAQDYGRFQYESTNKGSAQVVDGKLRIAGQNDEGDQRLFITSQRMIGRDRWPDKVEVRVELGGEEGNNYGWHLGVSVGKVKVLFHPGQSRGYFRAETTDEHEYILPNADMTFPPATGVMHEMTLRVSKTDGGADFDVTVKDGKGGVPYSRTFTVSDSQLGEYNRVGLERSGRSGGDALFDSISIRLER